MCFHNNICNLQIMGGSYNNCHKIMGPIPTPMVADNMREFKVSCTSTAGVMTLLTQQMYCFTASVLS